GSRGTSVARGFGRGPLRGAATRPSRCAWTWLERCDFVPLRTRLLAFSAPSRERRIGRGASGQLCAQRAGAPDPRRRSKRAPNERERKDERGERPPYDSSGQDPLSIGGGKHRPPSIEHRFGGFRPILGSPQSGEHSELGLRARGKNPQKKARFSPFFGITGVPRRHDTWVLRSSMTTFAHSLRSESH